MLDGLNSRKGNNDSGDGRRTLNLWFPGLPSQPTWPVDTIGGTPDFWHRAGQIALAEYKAALRTISTEGYESEETARHVHELVGEQFTTPLEQGWQAMPLLRDGCWRMEAAPLCPATVAMLDQVSLYPGDAMFSVLHKSTEIPMHHGLDNLTLTVHLPLIVPENCGIEVNGREYRWNEFEPYIFDDSYRHRAWNAGAAERIVFLFDIWHPNLTNREVAALRHIWRGLVRKR